MSFLETLTTFMGMSMVELVAAVLGIVAVWLTVRQNI